MDNKIPHAAAPGATPTPQSQPHITPIEPATPSPTAPTSPAAPVATPADPNVPTIPTAETTTAIAEPASINSPTPISEIAPTTGNITASAAPVATPADPNAPTVSTAINTGQNPEKTKRKKRLPLIIAIIGGIILIALAVLLYMFVFSAKTLSCEKSIGNDTMKVTVIFLHNEAQDANVVYTYASYSSITDSQFKTFKEKIEKENTVYESIQVEKTDDKTITVKMRAKRKLFTEKGKTYDEIKRYYTDSLRLTCN